MCTHNEPQGDVDPKNKTLQSIAQLQSEKLNARLRKWLLCSSIHQRARKKFPKNENLQRIRGSTLALISIWRPSCWGWLIKMVNKYAYNVFSWGLDAVVGQWD